MTTNTNRKSNLPAIAFALAALVSTIPTAAQAEQGPTARVSYGDLNLASDEGIKALDRRLDRAVKMVCGTPDSRQLHQAGLIRDCQEAARASIVPQRNYAIAQATGRDTGKGWAEASSRTTVVALSE